MGRLFNFSAGPATLPLEVLEEAAKGLVNYEEGGMGVPEMSHRSKSFIKIMDSALADVRELLSVPEEYEIMFLQGGASLQFSMVAMNLLHGHADYISTGNWSEKAIAAASTLGDIKVVASSKDDNFSHIPKDVPLSPGADYLHITSNNTIFGTQFKTWPKVSCPLVVDASSEIFSKPIDFDGVGLIYAGAQKNIGPSGVVLVIVRKDLVGQASEKTPAILNYTTYIKTNSMPNTPPTFAVYILGLVMKWIRKQGGVDAIAKRNEIKAALLYKTIDAGDFYTGTAKAEDRSLMNVTFTLPSEELTSQFLEGSVKKGMSGLKGYRSVGGVRASIYNAMPVEGVQCLADYMTEFAQSHS